jgi:hypothetical protein
MLECITIGYNEPSKYKNTDKAKVIRDKILRLYFVGEFHVSPLVNMPLSVLPEVMGQIEGHDNQSAIYRTRFGT